MQHPGKSSGVIALRGALITALQQLLMELFMLALKIAIYMHLMLNLAIPYGTMLRVE
jgi:hypothetical protein